MKKYKVKEIITYEYEIEAESKEEAEYKCDVMADLYICNRNLKDSEIIIVEKKQ